MFSNLNRYAGMEDRFDLGSKEIVLIHVQVMLSVNILIISSLFYYLELLVRGTTKFVSFYLI